VVAHAFNTSYLGGRDRRPTLPGHHTWKLAKHYLRKKKPKLKGIGVWLKW
jgi:hypothetical protein